MALDRRAVALALAAAIAVPAEGLRQKYYFDPPGILTVCYGYTGKDVDKTKTYSVAECRALLDKDMTYALNTVDKCVPGLPVPILAAFSDAAYNLGPDIACNTNRSTAARYLAARDYKAACLELVKWDKARLAGVLVALPGLTKRREAEKQLCLSAL